VEEPITYHWNAGGRDTQAAFEVWLVTSAPKEAADNYNIFNIFQVAGVLDGANFQVSEKPLLLPSNHRSCGKCA
jgi:hypothetical protein